MPSCMVCISFSSKLYTERHLFFSLILKNVTSFTWVMLILRAQWRGECFSVSSRERHSKGNRHITKVDLVRQEICNRILLLLKSKCHSRCANTSRKFAVCRSLCPGADTSFSIFQSSYMISEPPPNYSNNLRSIFQFALLAWHLNTFMLPEHRKRNKKEIKERED